MNILSIFKKDKYQYIYFYSASIFNKKGDRVAECDGLALFEKKLTTDNWKNSRLIIKNQLFKDIKISNRMSLTCLNYLGKNV